jgi:hypothetical protein
MLWWDRLALTDEASILWLTMMRLMVRHQVKPTLQLFAFILDYCAVNPTQQP